MTLLPVKQRLYEIFKLKQEDTKPTDLEVKQKLGVSITKAVQRDSSIFIFQQQNVFIQQTYSIVTEVLEMLDMLENVSPGIYPRPIPELPDEGENSFKGLAEFCLLCFKRGATWKEYKNVVQEAYMRTTIKNSRTWTEAAQRLNIQRTAIHRMAERLGVHDKPIDRREKPNHET